VDTSFDHAPEEHREIHQKVHFLHTPTTRQYYIIYEGQMWFYIYFYLINVLSEFFQSVDNHNTAFNLTVFTKAVERLIFLIALIARLIILIAR